MKRIIITLGIDTEDDSKEKMCLEIQGMNDFEAIGMLRFYENDLLLRMAKQKQASQAEEVKKITP